MFPIADLLDTLYNAAQNNLCYTDAGKHPLNPDFVGRKNIMLTEFGADENTDARFNEKIQYEINAAIEWGAYKVVYWGIYSNVRLNQETSRPTNEELQGLWLIRPDGSFTKAFWYIKSIISGIDYVTNTPKIVFSINESCSFVWENVKEKIIFYDDFTDYSKMIGLSQDKLILTTIDPQGANYKYFEEFNKYFSTVDTTGIVQSKSDNNLTYITYDMHSNRFGLFLYNFTSIDNYIYNGGDKLEELIIFEGKNKSNEWEKITNLRIEQTAAENRTDGNECWFQTLISGTTKTGEYSEIRVSIADKGYNLWDPIITGMAFFKGGEV